MLFFKWVYYLLLCTNEKYVICLGVRTVLTVNTVLSAINNIFYRNSEIWMKTKNWKNQEVQKVIVH